MGMNSVWNFVFVFFAFFSLYPLVLVLAFYPFRLGLSCSTPFFFYHTRWGLLDKFLFRFGTGILQGEKGNERRDCSRWRRRQWIGRARIGEAREGKGSVGVKGPGIRKEPAAAGGVYV